MHSKWRIQFFAVPTFDDFPKKLIQNSLSSNFEQNLKIIKFWINWHLKIIPLIFLFWCQNRLNKKTPENYQNWFLPKFRPAQNFVDLLESSNQRNSAFLHFKRPNLSKEIGCQVRHSKTHKFHVKLSQHDVRVPKSKNEQLRSHLSSNKLFDMLSSFSRSFRPSVLN